MAQTAKLATLSWQAYAGNQNDLIAPVLIDLNTYATVTVTPRGFAGGTSNQLRDADGVIVDNMQGTADLYVQIGQILEFVPRYQKTAIPLTAQSPDVVFSGTGTMPRVYFYTGTFRGTGNNLAAYASQQAANVDSITGGTIDAYLKSLRWKTNYQLSNGFNLDNITDSGFYDVLNPVNSGTSLSAGTWYIEHHTYSQSNLYAFQIARSIVEARQVLERRLIAGSGWSAWGPPTDVSQLVSVAAQAWSTAQQRQVRDNIGVRRWANQITGAVTMLPAALNSLGFITGNAYQVALPALATAQVGDYVERINYGTGTITFVPNPADPTAKLFYYNAVSVSSVTIGPGESAIFVTDGYNWVVGYRAKPPERTVDKAGDTMTGDLITTGLNVSTGPNAAVSITARDANGAAILYRTAGVTRIFSTIYGGDVFSASDAGALFSAQMGDLKTYIDRLRLACQCRLSLANSTTVQLVPITGNQMALANGRVVPAMYAQLSNSGLAANTYYYVGAYDNGSGTASLRTQTAALAYNAFGQLTSNGDNVVGSVRTNASGQFQDDPAYRGVCSFYNQQPKSIYGAASTGSVGTTFAEPNSASRVFFLCFFNQQVDLAVNGNMQPASFDTCYSYITINGGQASRILTLVFGGSGQAQNIGQRTVKMLGEGWQYASLAAGVANTTASVAYEITGTIDG